eukprot:scaffold3273_cov126-Isochrysis_galbana.AAC.5
MRRNTSRTPHADAAGAPGVPVGRFVPSLAPAALSSNRCARISTLNSANAAESTKAAWAACMKPLAQWMPLSSVAVACRLFNRACSAPMLDSMVGGGGGTKAACRSSRNSAGRKRIVFAATSLYLPPAKRAAACDLIGAMPPAAASASPRRSSRRLRSIRMYPSYSCLGITPWAMLRSSLALGAAEPSDPAAGSGSAIKGTAGGRGRGGPGSSATVALAPVAP